MITCVRRPMRFYHVLTTTNQIALTTFSQRPSCPYKYCATRCAFLFFLQVFMFRNDYGLRSKTSGMSKKGRIVKEAAGMVAEGAQVHQPAAAQCCCQWCWAEPDEIHGATEPQRSLQPGEPRARSMTVVRIQTYLPETVGPTSVASAIQ